MRVATIVLALSSAVALFGESGNADLRNAGVPADGGQNCSSCHSSFGQAITDSRDSLIIDAADYNPGVTQTIHVTVKAPAATRWGFQMTARIASDETKEAGTFSPVDANVQVRCDDGSRFGTLAPCNGAREFAEHSVAPSTPAGAGFTFDVNWSPPANEVGNVKLYVAAVAGDGNGTPSGDPVFVSMKTLSSTGACTLTRKPTLRTALNAASFQPAFSSNALLSVFGSDFQVAGRSRLVGSGDITNGMFPKQLACVAVEMNGQRVPISYIQQDQINIQAPSFTGSGPVSLVVILNPDKPNELRSDLGTLTGQQQVAPGFFTLKGSGSGGIAAQFANSATVVADPLVIPGARFAKPGDVVTLYGTGFGDTNPAVGTGQIASSIARLTNPVTVTINGTTLAAADVLYAGLSPGSISGLYQINVRLPATLPDGNVPVLVTIAGSQSQPGTTLPVRN